MRSIRFIVLIALLVVLAVLAGLNHTFLTYPHTLNLGFAAYKEVPMGLFLLLLMLVFLLVFYFWAGVTKLRAEASSAKLLRDLEGLRASLDTQEGSRFAQLQDYLDQKLSGNTDEAHIAKKIDAMQSDINLQLDQMDDYLKRKLGQ